MRKAAHAFPTSAEVQTTRIKTLADAGAVSGRYVLYWMQQAQRVRCNHALELAVQLANELRKPLVVGFGLHDAYPEANARHFAFLLEGLSETVAVLAERGIKLVVRRARPDRLALELGENACAIVCDRGYLRHQREWRRNVAAGAGKLVVEVETDVLVPVEVASNKAEYAARTLRPKLHRLWPTYLVDLEATRLERASLGLRLQGLDVSRPHAIVRDFACDRSVAPVSAVLAGGASHAHARLQRFLSESLGSYTENGKRPETLDVSMLSAYLHFGQIAPLEIALAVRRSAAGGADTEAFLEELLVRRELACNFVYHAGTYDSFAVVPEWARRTLAAHARDRRPFLYDEPALDAATTHDPYWNAAMREMKATGFLHNYMRMYWGKKILEWSASPEVAFRTTLALNNKYFVDGRDPNSYANVAWLFGLHDRPWGERPVFGTVRYMSASGLERKCDTAAYLARVEERIAASEGASREEYARRATSRRGEKRA